MYIIDKEKMTIVLSVSQPEGIFAPVLDKINNEGYRFKKEFHVTIVGFARGREVKSHLQSINADIEQVFKNLEEFLNRQTLLLKPTGDYYHLEKEVKFSAKPKEFRESIIALLEIPGFDGFWSKLENILQTIIPKPFLHLTLATRGTGSLGAWDGIGVKDEQDFCN